MLKKSPHSVIPLSLLVFKEGEEQRQEWKETHRLAVQMLVSVQQLYLIVLGQHPQSLSLCAFSLLEWWAVKETQKDKIAVDTVTKTAVCAIL